MNKIARTITAILIVSFGALNMNSAALGQLRLGPVQLNLGDEASVSISQNSGNCLGAAARNAAIASGEVLGLRQVMRSNGINAKSTVRGVRLCQQSGEFVYRFTEIKQNGRVVKHTLPAQ